MSTLRHAPGSWSVPLAFGVGFLVCTGVATAVATTAAVAVAEHAHAPSPTLQARPLTVDPAAPLLAVAVEADARMLSRGNLVEADIPHVIALYELYADQADAARENPTQWAAKRAATLQQLTEDLAEMQRLQQEAERLERDKAGRKQKIELGSDPGCTMGSMP